MGFRANFGQLLSTLYGIGPSVASTTESSPSPGSPAVVTRKALLLREAGRATRAWALIYLVMFVCLLATKWQTKSYYAADYQRRLQALEATGTEAAPTAATIRSTSSISSTNNNNKQTNEWWTPHEAMMEELVVELRSVTSKMGPASKQVERHRIVLEELRQTLEGLEMSSSSSSSSIASDSHSSDGRPRRQVTSTSLRSLLKQSDLSDMSSTAVLKHLFHQAISDLKQLLETESDNREHGHVDWASLDAQWRSQDFPAKEPSRVADDFECPVVITVESDNDSVEGGSPTQSNVVPSNAARQSDLVQRVQTIQDLLDRRDLDSLSSMVLPNSMLELEGRLKGEVLGLLQSIIGASKSVIASQEALTKRRSRNSSNAGAGGSSSCLTEDDVLELVDEGLLALYRQADLRNVLRKKVLELDPTAGSIILDADLPPSTPRIPESDTIQLRRLLDGPLLTQHMAPILDQLVELSGGYHDQLDQWLDSILEGRESVGAMAVRKLLDEASKVALPRPKTVAQHYLPTQVQAFLEMKRLL